MKAENRTGKMTRTGLLCAVLCIVAPFSIPLPFSPVPLSLATLVLYLSVFLLTQKQAMGACLVYLAAGLVGLPVFSGFSGGLGKLAGPTGGYLMGYPVLVFVAAWMLAKLSSGTGYRILSLFTGTVCCYILGTVWLCVQMKITFLAGLSLAVLPYLPLDLCKILAAALMGPKIAGQIRRAAG